MKTILIYWTVGCLILGAASGVHNKVFPDDSFPSLASRSLIAVAIWPALVAAAWIEAK